MARWLVGEVEVRWGDCGSMVAGSSGRWGFAKKKASSLVGALLRRRRAAAIDGELRKKSDSGGICRHRRLGFQGLLWAMVRTLRHGDGIGMVAGS